MSQPVSGMRRRRVAVGSDMAHATAAAAARHLEERGCEVVRLGAVGGDATPWPEIAEQLGRLVAEGGADQGVICCWTGTGVSIAANKVPGVRAALCTDAGTAAGARRWNDANVLALSLERTDAEGVRAILDAWLAVDGIDATEAGNIARIADLERRHLGGASASGGGR